MTRLVESLRIFDQRGHQFVVLVVVQEALLQALGKTRDVHRLPGDVHGLYSEGLAFGGRGREQDQRGEGE